MPLFSDESIQELGWGSPSWPQRVLHPAIHCIWLCLSPPDVTEGLTRFSPWRLSTVDPVPFLPVSVSMDGARCHRNILAPFYRWGNWGWGTCNTACRVLPRFSWQNLISLAITIQEINMRTSVFLSLLTLRKPALILFSYCFFTLAKELKAEWLHFYFHVTQFPEDTCSRQTLNAVLL